MNDEHLVLFVGMMADIAYEMHDMDGVSHELGGKLLELWRHFGSYTQTAKEES